MSSRYYILAASTDILSQTKDLFCLFAIRCTRGKSLAPHMFLRFRPGSPKLLTLVISSNVNYLLLYILTFIYISIIVVVKKSIIGIMSKILSKII